MWLHFACTIFFLFTSLDSWADETSYKATVLRSKVNVRLSPSFKGEIFSQRLNAGTILKVKKSKESPWLEISSPDSLEGKFIYEDMIQLDKETPEMSQVAPPSAVAKEETPMPFYRMSLNSMRLVFLEALQAEGSISTAMMNWTPNYQLSNRIGIGADIGASVFSNENDVKFFVMEFAATGEYFWTPRWSSEVLLGTQVWYTSNYDPALMAGVGGAYHYAKKRLQYIDRLVFTYTPVFQDEMTHEIKLGLGIKF